MEITQKKLETLINEYLERNKVVYMLNGNCGRTLSECIAEYVYKKSTVTGAHKGEIIKVINYLNEKTGKNYAEKATGANASIIIARLNEGYEVKDFKVVIDNKCDEWIDDNDMAKYIRPSTLFSRKHFEEYLNQEVKKEIRQRKEYL